MRPTEWSSSPRNHHETWYFVRYLVLGILLTLTTHMSGSQTYTFSSVQVIPKVDDLVGDEVSFTVLPGRTTLSGRWLLYEGVRSTCTELIMR